MRHFVSILLSVASFFALSGSVEAAELYFGADSVQVGIGSVMEIGVFVNADGDSINAVQGTVTVAGSGGPVRVMEAGSSVSLWMTPPAVAADGTVSFAGITPGGMRGGRIYLFSIVIETKAAGTVSVSSSDERILLDDGLGTDVSVRRSPLDIRVVEGGEQPIFLLPEDRDMPEPFVGTVTSDPTVFDGKWALVFAAQDKISGIDHYEIAEVPASRTFASIGASPEWVVAESPYPLIDQTRHSKILVRAVDRSGNVRETSVDPGYPPSFYERYDIWGILIVILAVSWLGSRGRVVWRKHRNGG